MNTQNTVEQLKTLKLNGMARRYEAALALPIHELQDAHALLAMVIQAEMEYREHSRTQKYLKASKLRYHALPGRYSLYSCNGNYPRTGHQALGRDVY